MKSLTIKAPAKINLHLQVLKKRKDKFHDINTVFQFIDLFDIISFELTKGQISLKEEPIKIKRNIVIEAASILKKETNTKWGANISLSKNIPIQKGLGGGSSDAAATLVGLNYLWGTELNEKELCQIGQGLGSDIPVFIKGTPAWGEGKGEILSKIKLPQKSYLLAFPEIGISTKIAFDNLIINSGPKYTLEEFKKGKKVNDFQNWAIESSNEIREAFDILAEYGEPMLTGTGSALFIELEDLAIKPTILTKILEKLDVIIVNSLDYSPLRPFLS